MKKSTFLALVFLGIAAITNAQTTILEARGKASGTVVTVKGIVTNGAELGTIRYFQDNTAGIAAYVLPTDISPIAVKLNAVNKGDSVTITGTIKVYGGLLELDPLTSVLVNSTGNPLPDPILVTPNQISEAHEGQLVQINNATFTTTTGTFAGNKTYTITANGESVNIFVKTGQNDIIGQPIPQGLVSLTGLSSQYYNTYNSPPPGYQLLPRTITDIRKTSSIYFTSPPTLTSFTQTELDFSWTTNIAGTTEMFYGLSPETVKSGHAFGTAESTSHSIALSGFTAGQIIWTQAFSVKGIDTIPSGIMPFATISNSSGQIKAYFNTPVDNSFSTGVNAIYLNQAIDDTLINYINRAKQTIDFVIYNFNNSGISNISNALKAAANRGVTVRVIGCGTTANYGVDDLAGSLVHVLIGPNSSNRNGIMHNKFFLFDTESANPNDPLVWTGSTNLTADQINLDANNVIIIQDQSLARGYKIEFEEMWGSNGITPNAANARFGSLKKNNTPHEYIINGKRVESYFSPTDGVNAQITQHINTTNNDLSIATMLLTRDEIASAIAAAKLGGAQVNMLTDASGNNGSTVNTTLLAALGTDHYIFYSVNAGIMHNKYMIVDEGASSSDPLVLTGSHNWSAAADNDNDENTLVIHDASIANIYYQNFVKLFVDNNGVLTGLSDISKTSTKSHLLVYPNPVQNGKVNISCFVQSADNGVLQLSDVNGKIVSEKAVSLNNGENILNYSFPGLHKGLYFIKLTTSKSVWNQKVLFE